MLLKNCSKINYQLLNNSYKTIQINKKSIYKIFCIKSNTITITKHTHTHTVAFQRGPLSIPQSAASHTSKKEDLE